MYDVYLLLDSASNIIDITSADGNTPRPSERGSWIYYDTGFGEKYRRADINYLPDTLYDRGVFRYKLVDSKIIQKTIDQMDNERANKNKPENISETLTMLENAILELANIIGGE